jgi:DNA-binding response OmpR family regulator
MSAAKLAGLRILVVEDDPIIALDIAQALVLEGALVIGPAHTVKQALQLVDAGGFDVAVLDYRLENEVSAPIADWLDRISVAYMFYTSSRAEPQKAYPSAVIVDKPTQRDQLVAVIKDLTRKSTKTG